MKSNQKKAKQFLAKMNQNNKGQSFGLNSIPQVVLILVIIGIVLVVGLSIMQSVQDDQGDGNCSTGGCSASFNASTKAIEGVSTIADNLPLIALVVVLGIIITVLIVSLGAFVLGRP